MSKPEAGRKPKLNRREAFQATASEFDAMFVAGKRSSGDQVHLEHGPWKVILDTYVVSTGQTTVTYTRARALYVAKNDFTLRISRRNIFTRIAELFGFYGLLVGDRELEHKYKIKSSNDRGARSLMGGPAAPGADPGSTVAPAGDPTALVGEAEENGERGPGGGGPDHGNDQ